MKSEAASNLFDGSDVLALAAEAVVEGRALESDWEVLAAFGARDGVDAIAARLAELAGPAGPGERWWRCNLLLSMELGPADALQLTNELLELEGRGEGPPCDPDRHALEVSATVRFLQDHLQHVLTGTATEEEHNQVALVVRVARLAQGRRT